MSATSIKMHLIATPGDSGGGARTYCGKEGWAEKNSATEYANVQGFIFEATTGDHKVTCVSCNRAFNSYSGGRP